MQAKLSHPDAGGSKEANRKCQIAAAVCIAWARRAFVELSLDWLRVELSLDWLRVVRGSLACCLLGVFLH